MTSYNKNVRQGRQNPRVEIAAAAVVMAVFLAADLAGDPLLSAALTAGAGVAGTAILLVTTGNLRPGPFAEGLLFAGVTTAAHLLASLGIRGMAPPLGQAAVAVLMLAGGGNVPGLPSLPAGLTRIAACVMLAAAAVGAVLAAWLDPGPAVLWGVPAVSMVLAAILVRRAAGRGAGPSFTIVRTTGGRFTATSGGTETCGFELQGSGSLASVTGLVVSSGASGWLALEAVGEAAVREGFSAILIEGDPIEETVMLQAGYSKRREGGWHRVIPITSRRAVRHQGRPG
ncbi:hypothetical protein GX411_00545 [Candidatus Fermentibacteria bacterium]|nr:hypothetical protein [Candidatus Fermentibacteria bacterium]